MDHPALDEIQRNPPPGAKDALMAATTWVDDEAALTKLLPVEEEKARKIGRMIRKVL